MLLQLCVICAQCVITEQCLADSYYSHMSNTIFFNTIIFILHTEMRFRNSTVLSQQQESLRAYSSHPARTPSPPAMNTLHSENGNEQFYNNSSFLFLMILLHLCNAQ